MEKVVENRDGPNELALAIENRGLCYGRMVFNGPGAIRRLGDRIDSAGSPVIVLGALIWGRVWRYRDLRSAPRTC
jgi:hypothetical protein